MKPDTRQWHPSLSRDQYNLTLWWWYFDAGENQEIFVLRIVAVKECELNASSFFKLGQRLSYQVGIIYCLVGLIINISI